MSDTADDQRRRTAALWLLCGYFRNELSNPIRDSMKPGDRRTAVLPNGADMGYATLSKPPIDVDVTDWAAFFAWVKLRHPEEIHETVYDAFVDKLKESAKKHGQAVDETTGEIVPGITVGHKSPQLKPYIHNAMKPQLEKLLTQLLDHGRLELPAGEDDRKDSA